LTRLDIEELRKHLKEEIDELEAEFNAGLYTQYRGGKKEAFQEILVLIQKS